MTDSPAKNASAPAGSPDAMLVESLPTASRLALAYAPSHARAKTLALLALDTRLAGLLRNSREPMLAQLRLSWWRETLGRDAGEWPEGEPLLATLRSWDNRHGELVALVDGWEALTAPAPLPQDAMEAMAKGRAQSFAALAGALGREGDRESAHELGFRWAIADLAMRLGDARERQMAQEVAAARGSARQKVGRALRPLVVLEGLAARRLEKGDEDAVRSPAAVLKAMRLGLFGR